jgi:aryl-alcohol dehydrogenase-like predicted oxidoreductase/adenylate kinase family enzyme
MPWLEPGELRVGLGCMRLPDESYLVVVHAAVDAGITVFDTARAYGESERLLGTSLRRAAAADRTRIVTKGGMSRPGGAWVVDGRAKAIRADCEASLTALDGLPVDLYLLHAPDPRTPWSTSVRALARLQEDGLVRRVGVCNVNRRQLDHALELAPLAAVQVALSRVNDTALRGGVVERCEELGLALLAHSPLGGPRRARRLDADEALGWLLGLSPVVVPIPGATRAETVRASARVAAAAPAPVARPRTRSTQPPRTDADVVLVMGIPGAGKSRVAGELTQRGYVRLNRDERGGSLRALAAALDELLASGETRAVLDNTYLTRAARNDVIEAAARHGAHVRCIWLDTPLAHAQVNMVERLLDRFGRLPEPAELKAAARQEPWLLAPTSQMRAARELEPPVEEEGFSSLERVCFERVHVDGAAGVFVAAGAADAVPDGLADAPHLVFDWGDRDLDPIAARLHAGVVETATCRHGGGAPVCWCRPPLPGLPLAFARRHRVDPARSLLVGTGPAHRRLAAALGARYVEG